MGWRVAADARCQMLRAATLQPDTGRSCQVQARPPAPTPILAPTLSPASRDGAELDAPRAARLGWYDTL